MLVQVQVEDGMVVVRLIAIQIILQAKEHIMAVVLGMYIPLQRLLVTLLAVY